MVEATKEMQNYFDNLQKKLDVLYKIAQKAREKGLDPKKEVETKFAQDVAGRVEGLVGPEGIAEEIRKLENSGMARTIVAYEIVKKLINENKNMELEKAIDQAVRTGVAILTEGVLVAPTEGIGGLKIKENPDGSNYLSIYFSGPIRSAGGTIAALSVVLADVARREAGIKDYRPTDSELERYVEEIIIYDARCARLQYMPTEKEIKTIVKNCPVCIDGDPTHKPEVSVHRDLERIETNRIRGGMALVIGEGIAQKAPKVFRYTKQIGLDWDWIESIMKVKSSSKSTVEIKPIKTYLGEILAGRPIFSYPMRPGGFRLRYGRTRITGIMAKAIHPATMEVLDEFPAIGTQVKIERPGKGCIVLPCDTIEPPIVKLKNGNVVKVNSIQEAKQLKPQIEEILFLGDMLITIGDFIKANHPLIPGAFCEEWWEEICKEKEVKIKEDFDVYDAFELAKEYEIPLHPAYLYFWGDIDLNKLKILVDWLIKADIEFESLGVLGIISLCELPLDSEEDLKAKRILEELCILHTVQNNKVILDSETAYSIYTTVGLKKGKDISIDGFNELWKEDKNILEFLTELSGVLIKNKAPMYIGSRMGRPEKAKEREMKPDVNVLFPLGNLNKHRDIIKTYNELKEKTKDRGIKVEIARKKCSECGKIIFYNKCDCGGEAISQKICSKCGREIIHGNECPCGGKVCEYDSRSINIISILDNLKNNMDGKLPSKIKGVKGLINNSKIPERLEKGYFRAKYDLSCFKDGTSRFDFTDAPITHFKPKEIGVSIKKIKELGYSKDYLGKEITNEDQVIEIFPQDFIVSEKGIDFFIKTANFIDDILIHLYQMEPFYMIKTREEVIGQLCVIQSPHTSAGILSRVIGSTKGRVAYMHPYLVCGTRRNCDGDENCFMNLMDILLNFSKSYLPETRGGTMDIPIVLTTLLNPKEVDDEVHSMEVINRIPLDFYEKTEKFESPNNLKIDLVEGKLDKPDQYENIGFTHDVSDINLGPTITTYVQFKSMKEKVGAQFDLHKKIRAVDIEDTAEKLILSHFIPDLYGNLRQFSQQSFRCVHCNAKYRRIPLIGKCRKCGGKIVLTVYEGGITKYLKLSKEMAIKYGFPLYLKQRLDLLERDIESIFKDEKAPQVSLSEFM
ncbi:MAG: DNA polymerase II large subunit [Candidatus Micrarchaeia archaeon]|jgi:DNA polymerase II large subunit